MVIALIRNGAPIRISDIGRAFSRGWKMI